MHVPSPDTLQSALSQHLAPATLAWLDEQRADRQLLTDGTKLRIAFARLARKLAAAADQPITPDGATFAWPLIDLARTQLLLSALDAIPPAEHAALIAELYRTADLREQQSILRALPALPDPARFVAVAIASCRTNSPAVFAAIASDNPFPAAHFPELHFNQLVLKAIFMGVPVSRIVGLEARATAELRRMVSEFASERRAAGRPVPSDVDHVLALSCAP